MIAETPQADKSSGIGDHQVCIPQSNERDEHSNSARSRMFQAIGNAIHDLLADAAHSQNQEHETGKEDDA